MKNNKFFAVIVAVIVIFAFALYACPELEEDPPEDGPGTDPANPSQSKIVDVFFDGPLGDTEWTALLKDIIDEGRFVHLDLSKATLKPGNTKGGLISYVFDHGRFAENSNYSSLNYTYVAFDPLYVLEPIPGLLLDVNQAKKFIVSIILPKSATIIKPAIPATLVNSTPEFAGKDNSAFRYFDNLRSVKGDEIKIIGNYAFIGRNTLEEVSFPEVGQGYTYTQEPFTGNMDLSRGHREDIGRYAFNGCSSLTRVTFPFVKIIGMYAFEGCTGLSVIESTDLTSVWMISDGVFKDCINLTMVSFRNAAKIGKYAFENCTSLKTARFLAAPARFSIGHYDDFLSGDQELTPDPPHPLIPFLSEHNPPLITQPLIPPSPGSLEAILHYSHPVTYDSVIFYDFAFQGCTVLETLDVSSAWNVYFAKGVFASIGERLDIHLFDDDGTRSYGHPQLDFFFGGGLGAAGRTSLRSVNFIVPDVSATNQILFESNIIGMSGLVRDIHSRYGSYITVTINGNFVRPTPK